MEPEISGWTSFAEKSQIASRLKELGNGLGRRYTGIGHGLERRYIMLNFAAKC